MLTFNLARAANCTWETGQWLLAQLLRALTPFHPVSFWLDGWTRVTHEARNTCRCTFCLLFVSRAGLCVTASYTYVPFPLPSICMPVMTCGSILDGKSVATLIHFRGEKTLGQQYILSQALSAFTKDYFQVPLLLVTFTPGPASFRFTCYKLCVCLCVPLSWKSSLTELSIR